MIPCVSRTAIALPAMLLATGVLTAAPAGGSCESLSSLNLPETTITTVQSVAAGAFELSGGGGRGGSVGAFKDLPGFCRVAATLKPSSDSDIKIEVWMPGSGWNGKYEGVG